MPKPKVGLYWCASCGGCEEAVVDLAEKILDVVAAVDIVFWPVALDFKKEDVEALSDGEMTAVFINGAVRLSEQEEMVRLLRRKAQYVIAFGSCAHLGGIPGLANLTDRQSIFQYAYRDAPTVVPDDGIVPREQVTVAQGELKLPEFWERVRALDQVIDVDYYLPGCPPTPTVIANALTALLEGNLPGKGAVLAGTRALCYECDRSDTKPEKGCTLSEIKRPWEIIADPEKCLLAQGILCLGPVTRGARDAVCVKGNMPCTGCFGPLDRVRDFGAKGLSAIASLFDSNDEAEIERLVSSIPDVAGLLYRYSLPASVLFKSAQTKGDAP